MQGMIRCALVAGLLIGCHTDDSSTPDGPASGAAGITIHWTAKPTSWPGAIRSGVTLEKAVFEFDSLRVIGDPGDQKTTARTFSVQWDHDTTPDIIEFADAPMGLYSQLALQVDGHLIQNSYRLEGKANVAGTDWDFRIEDLNALAITLSIDQQVLPGTNTDIDIDIDFTHALDAIDFSLVPIDDGRLQLETGNAQMTEFRKKLIESFQTPAFSAGAGST